MTGYVDRTWTSADGLELYARDYAAGPGPARLPVICLHGLTRNARDFEEVAPWIAARGRRVLACDVRGRGRSAWDPQPMRYVPLTYARDVLALMQQVRENLAPTGVLSKPPSARGVATDAVGVDPFLAGGEPGGE